MKKRIGLAFCLPLILLLLSGCLAWSQAVQERPPIIDMHLHAHTLSMYGTPPPSVCTNDQEIVFPGWDPRQPLRLEGDNRAMSCPERLKTPATEDELCGKRSNC